MHVAAYAAVGIIVGAAGGGLDAALGPVIAAAISAGGAVLAAFIASRLSRRRPSDADALVTVIEAQAVELDRYRRRLGELPDDEDELEPRRRRRRRANG